MLTDERLHLIYDGDLSIAGPDSPQPLRMEGSGTLNQHAVTFLLKADALPSAAPDKPYAFEFDEHSSGAHFTAHGSLPQPFDLDLVDAEFEASGADLRDLYYLVGVSCRTPPPFTCRAAWHGGAARRFLKISRWHPARAMWRGGCRWRRKRAAAPLRAPI